MALHSTDEIEDILKVTGGVQGTYNGATTWGHLDDPDEVVMDTPMGSGIVAGGPTFLIATGKFSDLEEHAPITVDGTDYEVSDWRRENEGAETRIFLRKVS